MNFKEIYKSANDSIHGDRGLIEKAIQKAQKKSSSKMIYLFASIAAVAIIVVAISVYPEKSEFTMPPIQVASNKDNNSTEKNIPANKEKDISKTDESIQEYGYHSEEKRQFIEKTAESEIPEHESDSLDAKEELAKKYEASENIAMDSSDAVSFAGTNKFAKSGGGSDASNVAIAYEGITAEQYCDYIGTDITKKVILPEKMYFETFYGTVLKSDSVTGDVISDDAEFNATGNGKKLSVSVTKLLGEVYKKLNDSTLKKTDISGNVAVIESYETVHKAYVNYLDLYYKIYAEGFSYEELQNVLLSLCSN